MYNHLGDVKACDVKTIDRKTGTKDTGARSEFWEMLRT